jgi:hypothetical protein
MDMQEMVGKLRRGEPLYGVTSMDPYNQQVAASQSRYAQLKFRNAPQFLSFPFPSFHSPFFRFLVLTRFADGMLIKDIFPFFNFANHNYHGVNVQKYYDALKAENEADTPKEYH